MDLSRKSKFLVFFAALLLLLVMPTVYPKGRLLFFAPFLIIVFYQKGYVGALWYSFFCGMIVDILSSNPFIGTNSFSYCITTAILYSQRRHFFSDSITTMPLMTYFFAILTTMISLIFEYMFQNEPLITPYWLYTDLLLMPLFDSIYAFTLFILPAFALGKPQRRSKDYFLHAP
jgi:rod shape-determining protein MreD